MDRAEESSVYAVGWNPTCPKSNQQGYIEFPMRNGNRLSEAGGKGAPREGYARLVGGKPTQLKLNQQAVIQTCAAKGNDVGEA